MTNALRITLGLLAALTLMGCQKNADKLGVSVRGRSAPLSGTVGTSSTGSYNTSVSNINVVSSMVAAEVATGTVGSFVGMNTIVHMCNTVSAGATTTLSASNAHIEVDVYDSYALSTGQPIVTYLPLVSGYTQSVNGYTYIAAEFGDGLGNIAFDGYIDNAGNLLQGRVFNNTFSTGQGILQMGTFTLSGTSWLTTCTQ